MLQSTDLLRKVLAYLAGKSLGRRFIPQQQARAGKLSDSRAVKPLLRLIQAGFILIAHLVNTALNTAQRAETR